MTNQNAKCLAVVRLRGRVGIGLEREYTFKLMHLARKNHAILVEGTPSTVGSIRKIKDYATWGEASIDTISSLLTKRGRLDGGMKLTEEYIQGPLDYPSIDELSKSIYDLRVRMTDLPKLKPVFRLHPPRKGFRGSIKKPYPKSELGYRGEAINTLIAKMV